jgi:Arc/MetJ family transcription regulator
LQLVPPCFTDVIQLGKGARPSGGGAIDEYTKFVEPYTRYMRTNIDIDDNLMRQAMRSSGARTKRAVVEEGLRLLIRTRDQRTVRRLRGTVAWNGDLERSRLGRSSK